MASALRSATAIRIARGACATVLAANVAVIAIGLGGASAAGPSDRHVQAGDSGEAAHDAVLISLADGSKIVVDPATPEGRAAIAEAEARGGTATTVPADDVPVDAVDARSGTPAAATGDGGSDAATQLLLDARRAVEDATDAVEGVVDDVVEAVDGDGDGTPEIVGDSPAPGEPGDGADDGGVVGGVVDDVTDTVDGVVDDVTETVDGVTDTVDDVVGGDTGDTVDDVVGGVDDTVDTVVDDVVEPIVDAVVDPVVDDVVETVDDVVENLPIIGGSDSGTGGLLSDDGDDGGLLGGGGLL